MSVDTDVAVLRRTLTDGSVNNVAPAEGWESTGATPTLSAKGDLADAANFAKAATADGVLLADRPGDHGPRVELPGHALPPHRRAAWIVSAAVVPVDRSR